jgi:tetratricopeptide (TPR) repeat protein
LASRLVDAVPAITRLGTSAHQLGEALASRPYDAATIIEAAISADAEAADVDPRRVRLLIYIDQLEEAFSNPDASAGEASLIEAIVTLSRSPSIWIAATIRSDFVHRLEAYSELMQDLSRNPSYTLLPPRPDELAEMIREPARAAGLTWEQRDGVSLDNELLRDATGNPESLPLLEYTLAELYERREGRALRWSEYGGGLKGALIKAADEVVDGAGGDIDTAFRDVMRELVSVGEDGAATRRYASMTRFPAGTAARALLDRLVARRLCITTDEGLGDGPVTSLAHEALIRSWPRAQMWLQRETALLRVRDEVARDAAVWDYHKRVDGWLGVAPEKLAAIRQVEDAGLMPAGAAADYAAQSRRRGRRNRIVRRAALAGICSLTVIAAIAAWLALKQRDVARTEAATSDRTTKFMVGLFQLADPDENRGNAITVKEVLDKGAKEIQSTTANSLEREPRVRAELLTAMGQAYTGLGLYKPAENLLSQAQVDVKSASVPDETRVRTLVAAGFTLQVAGKFDESEAILRPAVLAARRSLKPSDPLFSEALTVLADTLSQLEKYPEAEQLCLEAIAVDRKRGPEYSGELAKSLESLGTAYFYSGNLTAAEPAMREALQIREQTLGIHSGVTALAMNNLGVLLYQTGRFDEALQIYRQVLPIQREVYGAEHSLVATDLNNIGRVSLMVGQVDEAEPLLREALTMTVKVQGETHPEIVSPLNSLAMIDAYRGHIDAALGEIKRAEAVARMPDHGELLDQVLLNEADIQLTAGDRAKASGLLMEAKDLLNKAHPRSAADAWRYAVWDAVHAQLLAENGDAREADRILSAAQPVIIHRFGPKGFYSVLADRRALLIAKKLSAS